MDIVRLLNYRKDIFFKISLARVNFLASIIIEFRDSKEDDDESCSPRIEGRLALPPRMVIDADRERSVNRKLGVRSDKYAALRRAAVDSIRLGSTRFDSNRQGVGGRASLILVSKSSSGIQGRAVYKGVGVRNRRNGERNVKASILGRGKEGAGKAERRRKFGWGKRVSRASFEETSYRAQSAR